MNFEKLGSEIHLHISRYGTPVQKMREVFLNESVMNKNLSCCLKIPLQLIGIHAENL